MRARYALAAGRSRGRRIEDLGRRRSRVGLAGVLADLDRDAQVCPVPGDASGEGFTWDPRDRDDTSWWPQGIASAAPPDAPSSDVLLVSWYAKRARTGRTPGVRISVVDRSRADHPRYRHVRLVTPRRRPLGGFGTVPLHAGGIAVFGDLLYVADTIVGVRVFRLSDTLRVRPRRRGGSTPDGDEYVMPELVRLRVPLADTARLRFSFLSIGTVEGQLSLIAGEYRRKDAGSPRLVRYPLDAVTGLPVLGDDGRCAPVEVHADAPPRMQGVAVHDSTWYISASSGKGRPGDLHVGAPGALRRHRGVMPTGPEDLAWSSPGRELWCVTEWPGQRWVFPIDADRWRGSHP